MPGGGARHASPLLGERSNVRLGLRVRQISQLRRHTATNCGDLGPRLEAREVRTIAPRQWSAEPDLRVEGRIMHDVDKTFVIR